ncbi:MAG: fasciclin domain-containing protein [Alphaproteobacteria bacterium]|nr:fasciclin domain-containing protein [Alphaproteobacteria bacterium]
MSLRKMIMGAAVSLPLAVVSANATAADIVDTAVSADNFNTLVQLVEAAGLVETLKSEGPFTVFAPTDEAFAELPDGTLQDLLAPENREQLRTILTYHVVPSEVPSSAAVGEMVELETVEGSALTVDGTGDSVMVDGATVVQPDVMADNGIIHVIDTVLIPEM